MKLYLGVHRPGWLERTDIPLFVSRRVLMGRKALPAAKGRWALDSGAFTELSTYGRWLTSVEEYAEDVERFQGIGGLDFVAPQDWMCEPHMLLRTGKSIAEHQHLTVDNFLELRERLGPLVIPVLQGFTLKQYHRCWQLYEQAGVELEDEPIVGLGSVCRRQNTSIAGTIVRSLEPLKLHGFGVKVTGIRSFGDVLVSSDSMAWSYRARRSQPLPGCTHTNCANCFRFAERWYRYVNETLGQERLCVS